MIGLIETDDSMDIGKDFVKCLDIMRMCIKKANNEPLEWRVVIDIFLNEKRVGIDIFLNEKIDFFDKSKVKIFFLHNFPIFGEISNLNL